MKATPHITSWTTVLLLLALTAPVLYVASIGPACWWGLTRTVNIVYRPLIAACDETPLEKPLCTWIEWWHPAGRGAWTAFRNGEVIWEHSQRDG